jgi:hypothetical protein
MQILSVKLIEVTSFDGFLRVVTSRVCPMEPYFIERWRYQNYASITLQLMTDATVTGHIADHGNLLEERSFGL